MRNYSAKDLCEWVRPFLPKIQYVMVVHTDFHPFNQSMAKIRAKRLERSKMLEEAMKSVSLKLYDNDPKLPFRNRYQYRLISFTTVEGLSPDSPKEMTMHFNLLLGNLPQDFTKQKLWFHFAQNWVGKSHQSDDIWLKSVEELAQKSTDSTDTPIQVISRYFLKDAFNLKSNAWDTDGTLDVQNTWLSHEATTLK